MADQPAQTARRFVDQLPTDQLKQELQELLKLVSQRATKSMKDVAGGHSEKETDNNVGKQAASGDVKKAAGGGLKRAGEKVKEAVSSDGDGTAPGKVTNIIEEIDVGVPVHVAYDQWTRFTEFPSFMKKVEDVEQVSDTELKWRGKILWSNRDWHSTIRDQIPDERIVWHSEGTKGYVDGVVTFHELSPSLTRILLVLEYYPNGFFEKTANLWRAQGRRARLELKHFRRHVMTRTALHQRELSGWRGEIHDGEVREQTDQTDERG